MRKSRGSTLTEIVMTDMITITVTSIVIDVTTVTITAAMAIIIMVAAGDGGDTLNILPAMAYFKYKIVKQILDKSFGS